MCRADSEMAKIRVNTCSQGKGRKATYELELIHEAVSTHKPEPS